MTKIKSLCAGVLLCCCLSYGQANTIVINPGPGFNASSSANQNIGFDFTVGSTLMITALGLWDGPNDPTFTGAGLVGDGFQSEHFVGLWDNSGNLLAKTTMQIGMGDPLIGQFRYSAVFIPTTPGPVILSPGTTYVLGAAFIQSDPDTFRVSINGNQASFDPAVTAGNLRRSSSGFTFPDANDGPGSAIGPNAQFTLVSNAVPETGVSVLFLALVLTGLIFAQRRIVA